MTMSPTNKDGKSKSVKTDSYNSTMIAAAATLLGIHSEQLKSALEGLYHPEVNEEYLTYEEVGKMLKLSRVSIYHMIKSGKLRVSYVTPGRPRILKSSVINNTNRNLKREGLTA